MLSRILAELRADFEEDIHYDYFKLAQLFDPRVCRRTSFGDVDRLLQLAVRTYIPLVPDVDRDQDDLFAAAPAEDYADELLAFKKHMRQARTMVEKDRVATYSYFGATIGH